jgi:hypothetical protein
VAEPALDGAKVSWSVRLRPAFTASGNAVSARRNPAPFELAELIVASAVPELLTTMVCVFDAPTCTCPKLTATGDAAI